MMILVTAVDLEDVGRSTTSTGGMGRNQTAERVVALRSPRRTVRVITSVE